MKPQKLDSKILLFIKDIRIAVLVLGTAILFYACENNEIDKIQAFSSPEELPILETKNFVTLMSDSGLIRNSLRAPVLLQFDNGGKSYYEFPEGMELVKFDEHQNIISSITADYAKQFVKEKKWEAKNNVVVTNERGDSLKTEVLTWEEKTEKIYTEEFVKIIRDNQIITGVGLTSDQNMLNWKIKNPKGTIYISVDEKEQNAEANSGSDNNPKIEPQQQPKTQAIKFK